MLRFLLDANLSPETAAFLRQQFLFNVTSLLELNQSGLSDKEIISLAKREARIIVTLDLDFGELYHEVQEPSSFGVIILRLRDQRVEKVNQILQSFFQSLIGRKLFEEQPHALVVIDESSFRIVK